MTDRQQTQQHNAPSPSAPAGGLLQRACACGNHMAGGGECERCQRKRLQRFGTEPASDGVPAIVHEVLRASGQPLAPATRVALEPRFGHDFSRVRVHTDAQAAASARSVNALAYTVGSHVAFGSGQYAPGTLAGDRLIAHELAHVVQQRNAPAGVQAKLAIDAPQSSAEQQADQAAQTALAGGTVANLNPLGPLLSRQEAPGTPRTRVPLPHEIDFSRIVPQPVRPPTPGTYRVVRTENGANEDERIVVLSTGQRYRVRRHRNYTRRPGSGGPFTRLEPGIDRERLWMELEWCADATEGTVRVGANVPDRVTQIIVAAATSGSDIDRVLREVQITPYSEAELRVGSFRISAGAETTIDREGSVTDIQGRVRVETDTPYGRVGVEGRAGSQRVGEDPLGGAQGGITFTWTPGASPRSETRCDRRRERIVEQISYTCQLEEQTPERQEERRETVTRTDSSSRFIYFDYARASIDRRRSDAMLTALRDDLAAGFQVAGITGFTSPEGPQAPGRRFQGNEQLARERAAAALAEVQRMCTTVGAGSCLAGEAGATGAGELYTLRSLTGDEVEGAEQADFAAAEFLRDEREASHRTEELTRDLGRARTPQARADLVYPLLRRAEVRLTRSRQEQVTRTETIPAQTTYRDLMGRCPDDIVQAAFRDARR
jgi:hypothetical protein